MDNNFDAIGERLVALVEGQNAIIERLEADERQAVERQARMAERLAEFFGEHGKRIDDVDRRIDGIHVVLENKVYPQFRTLAEGQASILEKLVPRSRVDDLEEELRFLRSMVGVLADKVKELEKAV